jgi:hypothetical protein
MRLILAESQDRASDGLDIVPLVLKNTLMGSAEIKLELRSTSNWEHGIICQTQPYCSG